jgi:hypothetical protein
MKPSLRVFAAIKASKNVSAYATQCEAIVDKLDGNPDVPSPSPPLSEVRDHIAKLREAEKLARGGPQGAVQDRDVKLGRVRSDMNQLKASVQSACDRDPERARAIIESAGMQVAKKYTRTTAPISVRYGKVSGAVVVVARAAGRKATYFWQMSENQADWSDLPMTMVASIPVVGLEAAKIYYFRVRTFTRAGLSVWSMVARIIAH